MAGATVVEHPALAAYASQRCACGALGHFGFGHPMVRGETVWACMKHRDNIDRYLTTQAHDDLFGKDPP